MSTSEESYAMRNKTIKFYVIDVTPEDFDFTILSWSHDAGRAAGFDNEADVFNVITQLCNQDARLKPCDLELVLVKTIVEPTEGQYAVEEIEQPEWFVETVEDVVETNHPKRGVSK